MANIGDMAICLKCGDEYTVVKGNQKYCCRSCFRKANYKKHHTKKFPSFKCSKCGKLTKLTFHINEEPDKWETLQCPNCGIYNYDTIDPFELLEDKLKQGLTNPGTPV